MTRFISVVDPVKTVAGELNDYFRGKRVHFFGIDYSGQRELKRFLDILHKYVPPDFELTESGVGMAGYLDKRFGEFRPLTDLDTYDGGDQKDAFVAVENTAVHTGRSAISGPINILYGMHGGIIPGKGHTAVYLMTTEGDTIGVSNFAARRQFGRYVGVKKHMARIAPATYLELGEFEMLPQVSEREPEAISENIPEAPDTIKTVIGVVKKSRILLL